MNIIYYTRVHLWNKSIKSRIKNKAILLKISLNLNKLYQWKWPLKLTILNRACSLGTHHLIQIFVVVMSHPGILLLSCPTLNFVVVMAHPWKKRSVMPHPWGRNERQTLKTAYLWALRALFFNFTQHKPI